MLIAAIGKFLIFTVSLNTVSDLRKSTFANVVKQPSQFYDETTHSIGNLTSMLSSDINYVRGVSVEIVAAFLLAISGVISGVVITYCYYWVIGTINLAIIPINFICVLLSFMLQYTSTNEDGKSEQKQRLITSEILMNHTTVATLSNEDVFLDRYLKNSEFKSWVDYFKLSLSSLLYAFSIANFVV